VAPPLDQLVNLAKAVQAAIVERWPTDAAPLPARRYVTFGASATTVWDAEQFTVSLDRTFGHSGDISQETWTAKGNGLWYLRAASFDLTIVRKYPIATQRGQASVAPTPEVLEAAAVIVMTDARAMENALIEAMTEDPALAVVGGRQFAFEAWSSFGPDGDMGGGILRVRIQVL
jgi:hypothetical protein